MRDALTHGSYHDLAEEYYDAERHPTCANFREGSVLLVERWLGDDGAADGPRWDVGAGDSVLAEVLAARGVGLEGTTALDESPSMLAHSEKWTAQGLRLAVGDAASIPAEDRSAGLVVASLGDPYNTDGWWAEIGRILAPDGTWPSSSSPTAGRCSFRRSSTRRRSRCGESSGPGSVQMRSST